MLSRTAWIIVIGIFTSSRSGADPPTAAEAVHSGKVIERLQGDTEVEARGQDNGTTFYFSGIYRVTTPLPVGYPPPTPPGVIEVKSYPEVRRADVPWQRTGSGRNA